MQTVEGRACRTPDGLWEIVDEGTGSAGTLTTSAGTPSATAGTAPATAATPPRHNRQMVYETQELLTLLGYDPGPIDGLYGSRTGSAISTYQRNNSLLVDGQPSPQLLDHLRTSAQNRSTSAAPAPAPTVVEQEVIIQPIPAAPGAPAPPSTTQQATTPPAASAPGGEIAVATLARDGSSLVGQDVTASGTYLHYNGNWAKLLSDEGSSSDFVYILLDGLSESQRTSLRNDCFLCHVRTSGQMQMRELEFAGSSLGAVPTIVVTELARLD